MDAITAEAADKDPVENESRNILDMSDEEISNMEDPSFADTTSADEEGTTTNATDEQSSDESGTDADSESTAQDETGEAADSDSTTSDTSSSDDEAAQTEAKSTDDKASSEDPKTSTDTETLSADDQLKKLLSPFRANGKDIQVDNVDDAITLMQMGANFNKKMAGLKPNLKFVKMLENEGLLDEGKLANLIDLSKKNPAAIKQLIKDSGIDPLTVDVKEDTGYTPDTYNVDDTEIELDLVLDDLKSSPKFSETMDVINNKFDAASKKVLVESPAIIRVLNEHIELGIYDKIATVVERERMLGRLTGLNDLQAYKQVSDAINAKGGLNSDSKSTSEKTDKPVTTKTAASKTDEETKARKKSAASNTSTPGKKADADFNPLSMSDEDIAKMPLSKYM